MMVIVSFYLYTRSFSVGENYHLNCEILRRSWKIDFGRHKQYDKQYDKQYGSRVEQNHEIIIEFSIQNVEKSFALAVLGWSNYLYHVPKEERKLISPCIACFPPAKHFI